MPRYEFRLLQFIFHAAGDERANIGLLFWCPENRLFWYQVNERHGRLSNFFRDFDAGGYKRLVASFKASMRRVKEQITGLSLTRNPSDMALDTLLAKTVVAQSNVLGLGPLMGGVSDNPERRAEQIF